MIPGLLRQARYLLRSCLYAQAIAEDDPCFSLCELAARHGDLNLARLLASSQPGEATYADFEECLSGLRRIIGDFPPANTAPLRATVVNEWKQPSDSPPHALPPNNFVGSVGLAPASSAMFIDAGANILTLIGEVVRRGQKDSERQRVSLTIRRRSGPARPGRHLRPGLAAAAGRLRPRTAGPPYVRRTYAAGD